jgi:hypothetical protein
MAMGGTIVALVLIGLAMLLGIFIVFGGGFRSGRAGGAEGGWGRSGERVGGTISPPFLLVGSLLAFAGLLLAAAIVVGVT